MFVDSAGIPMPKTDSIEIADHDSLAELDVAVGDVLADKYRVTRVLGSGGMGVVVAAIHVELEEKVALKFLNPRVMHSDEVATERFLREAKAAVKLKSEHVARVRDVGTLASGSPYMVLEHLEGCDLKELLDRQGPTPHADAVLYVVQACEALAHAHAIGLIHRDLKPPNLFLTKRADGSPCVKVLDFGISKFLSGTTSSNTSLTKTNSIVGSPRYIAPELWESARHASMMTDIWALGAILFELISGEPVHPGESLAEVCRAIQLDKPKALTSLVDIPDELDAAVQRALAKAPGDRFPNVAELAMALYPFGRSAARPLAHRVVRILDVAGKLDRTVPIPAASIPPGVRTKEASRHERNAAETQDTVIAANAETRSLDGDLTSGALDKTLLAQAELVAPRPAESSRKFALIAAIVGGIAVIAVSLPGASETTAVAPPNDVTPEAKPADNTPSVEKTTASGNTTSATPSSVASTPALATPSSSAVEAAPKSPQATTRRSEAKPVVRAPRGPKAAAPKPAVPKQPVPKPAVPKLAVPKPAVPKPAPVTDVFADP